MSTSAIKLTPDEAFIQELNKDAEKRSGEKPPLVSRPYDPYGGLRKRKYDATEHIAWHLTGLLKVANRRMTKREKFRDPWTVSVSRTMRYDTFRDLYKVFREFRGKAAVRVVEVPYKTANNKEFISMQVSVNHMTRLRMILSDGFDIKLAEYEERKLPGKFVANLVVDLERAL